MGFSLAFTLMKACFAKMLFAKMLFAKTLHLKLFSLNATFANAILKLLSSNASSKSRFGVLNVRSRSHNRRQKIR